MKSLQVKNIWCGFDIKDEYKEALTEISLAQFNLPVKDRSSTKELLSIVGVKIKLRNS